MTLHKQLPQNTLTDFCKSWYLISIRYSVIDFLNNATLFRLRSLNESLPQNHAQGFVHHTHVKEIVKNRIGKLQEVFSFWTESASQHQAAKEHLPQNDGKPLPLFELSCFLFQSFFFVLVWLVPLTHCHGYCYYIPTDYLFLCYIVLNFNYHYHHSYCFHFRLLHLKIHY